MGYPAQHVSESISHIILHRHVRPEHPLWQLCHGRGRNRVMSYPGDFDFIITMYDTCAWE